jgi:hypothetical protein
MANTPKAMRKDNKSRAANNKTFSKYQTAAERLKPASPKKAKEAVNTLSKKVDKTSTRVKKTRAGVMKADNAQYNKETKAKSVARRARVMGK